MDINKEKYAILGTLGDDEGFLTCSMHIAKKMDNSDMIKPYPEFEADCRRSEIRCDFLSAGAWSVSQAEQFHYGFRSGRVRKFCREDPCTGAVRLPRRLPGAD